MHNKVNKILDFFSKNIPIVVSIFLIVIAVIALSFFFKKDKQYISLNLKLESVNENFNSNQIKLTYDETEKIEKVVLNINDSEITMLNGSVFELSEKLDGKEYKLKVVIYYTDGSKETFNQKYKLYNECEKTINKVEKTSCSDGQDKYYETIVDKFTNKICRNDVNKNSCDGEDKNTDTGNSNSSDDNTGTGNSDNSSDTGNPSENPESVNNGGCSLRISKGTIGLNNWYVSDVTLALKIEGSNVSKYGITTSSTASYNSKKTLTISSNHNTKKYYGYVQYKDGTKKVCSISLKIDKTKPTVPTSEIKKNNSSGEVLENSSSYRNYKVWWGNYNSTDKDSGIDHYEYSSNCSGTKTGTLKKEYIYPSDGTNSLSRTYCIRSVDKAGNYSNWSTSYYFNIKLQENNSTSNPDGSSNTDDTNEIPEDTNNKGCTLNITSGKLGLNNWYVSDVTLALKIEGSNVSKYGITTSSTASYNSKKTLTISSNHNTKKYYGYVQYKDGTKKVCSISLKIDKTKPTVPTSEIKKNNSSGEVLENSSSYRNYKVWWGNYNSTDKDSGIDHYEYSSNCSGTKNGDLRKEYIYPLDGKDSLSSKFCIRSVDKAGNYSNWSSSYYFNIDLVKPTCSVSMTTGSSEDTLTVTANDSHSGISSYSYNNSSYNSSNVYKIKKGTKVKVSVKDKAGNIGTCINYKNALILVGDSRTYRLQKDIGGQRILTNYEDIYFVESYDNKEVYAVAKSGATRRWFLGTKDTDAAGAYKVQYLLSYLSNQPIYYDVRIASNLGVNDINVADAQYAASQYTLEYDNLLNNSQSVYIGAKKINSNWKKSGNVIGISFNFISVNPIDEKLLNTYSPSNARTTNKINLFNSLMKKNYDSRYLDASSNFNYWFTQAVNAGQPKFAYGKCKDNNNNEYTCEDGIHYSNYINKNFIYPFYKTKLLG